jgi:WD repeat-containing protein 76
MEDGDSNMRTTVGFDLDVVDNFVQSAKGKGTLRGEHEHQKSASSAFWDPHGRRIVSTSYDDTLRRTLVYLF